MFVLLIHATVLLIITAQKNLTPSGQASQTGTLRVNTNAINAIQPPISNTFQNGHTIYCTFTTGYDDANPLPAWWMFEFSFESAYITEIQIYYREGQAARMDGFKLYVTNTSAIPPVGYLCYEDGPGLPSITQTIPCNQLGKYVIYYDDTGSTIHGPIVELCYVAIYGCQKSFWGSNCQNNCAEDCIERNCFPGNGSCIWGCNPTNCLNDVCDKDTAVCTIGCKERRTGTYCKQYNIAFDVLVSQSPYGSQLATMANDGNKLTCSKTQGTSVTFQVDLKEKSIVTGLYILLGEDTTKEGYHTVYASNNSKTWNSGIVLYNQTFLPTEISFQEVFTFLTYVPPVGNPITVLEMCEMGIIGCPPTHFGPLCNTTCPHNCNGPCELDVGDCLLGCTNGWTGNRCDKACDDGNFGNNCANRCFCLTEPCSKDDGMCQPSGCKKGWYGESCNKECNVGYYGRNCGEFCGGCISNVCDTLDGLCKNTTGCEPGYLYEEYCNTICEDGYFGNNCTLKCNCLTGTCNGFTGKCSEDGTKSRHEETSNAAAIGGGVAAFIIVVLILVAAFIVYKRRCILTQDGVQTKSNDATTYENRNATNNSNRDEPHYDDLIRMDTASTYQDLTSHSAANEYEQIDNTYVNQSLQI